jgi:N-formylglutamate amidohydrolase
MKPLIHFSLPEIVKKLQKNKFPFSGITLSGSAEFHFLQPSFYAGVAMHAGNRVRSSLNSNMAATEKERFREEDPYTDRFLKELPIQIIARDSRFEYDLNREPARAIYSYDREMWGIRVWRNKLSAEEKRPSLDKHQEFHDLMDVVVEYLLRQGTHSMLLDMHSFCYLREETTPWYKDPGPEINIGSKVVDREVFGEVIEDFKHHLSGLTIDGHPIRVAENEVFAGGYLARRLSKAHPNRLLVLAMEYKKIFMDEVTGEVYDEKLDVLIEHFNQAVEKIVQSGFFLNSSDDCSRLTNC